MTQQPVGSPKCFGKEFAASEAECAGGPDPAYLHPKTNTNMRDRCGWYSACASVSAQNKARTQLVPPQHLVRPVTVQGPPRPAPSHAMVGVRPQVVQQPGQMMMPQMQQMMQPMPQMAPGPQYPYMVAPYVAQQGPQAVPMTYQQPGAQMPHYLTVPEPINLNESPFRRLGREILRSILKAGSHTSASFFDSNPWHPHEIPRDDETG